MSKKKNFSQKAAVGDKNLLDAVERSDKLISELLSKLDLTDEERTSADILSMELLRAAISLFGAARADAKKHRVHLRIRVAQAALAAALQGLMTYPAESGE